VGDKELKKLLRILRAVADESRLKILGLVADQERSVGELAQLLGLREPTVSHHLSTMMDADLLAVRRDGTSRYYRLRPGALDEINRALMTPGQVTSLVDDVVAIHRQGVIDRFRSSGRLPKDSHQIPYVLRWLRDHFREDTDYSEAEVDDVLRRYYKDHASLRRMMVDRGYLKRSPDGIYRYGLMAKEREQREAQQPG
jgi:DNA-binding transcriptional ArsR family regulator